MNEQTAEVVRLRNQGVMPKAIAARLHINPNTVASRLWAARQAGLITAPIAATAVSTKKRVRKRKVGDEGSGAAGVNVAQQITAAPELRKTTPARDAVIRELYPVEQDRQAIVQRINELPGVKVDWNEVTWRASHLGLRRPPMLVSKAPLTPPPPSAAFIGKLSSSAAQRCVFPLWGNERRPGAYRFCDAPVAVISRPGADQRVMQYCNQHCRRAFTNWRHCDSAAH